MKRFSHSEDVYLWPACETNSILLVDLPFLLWDLPWRRACRVSSSSTARLSVLSMLACQGAPVMSICRHGTLGGGQRWQKLCWADCRSVPPENETGRLIPMKTSQTSWKETQIARMRTPHLRLSPFLTQSGALPQRLLPSLHESAGQVPMSKDLPCIIRKVAYLRGRYSCATTATTLAT